MIIFFIILFLLAFHFYIRGRKAEVLFCLTALATNCFAFVDSGNSGIKPSDLVILFSVVVSLMEFLKDSSYFNVKGDTMGRILLIIFIYITIVFMMTVFLRIETFSYALKVVRIHIVLLLYFYMRKMRLQTFEHFFRLILVASIVQGVFYYLQMVGVEGVISGRVDDNGDDDSLTRYANYPRFVAFFVLFYIVSEKDKVYNKIIHISFFFMMYIFGQMRGAIIAMACSACVFFWLKKKKKYFGYLVMGLVAYQFVVAPMFEYRTRSRDTGTIEEIVQVIREPLGVYKNYTDEGLNGTFAFRIAILSERMEFLLDNPRYLPFGVGCIHEESPNNHFYFLLGTHNELFQNGRTMLGSADIAWVSILMHYGLIGAALFLLLFYYWMREGLPLVRNNNSAIFIVASIISISAFLSSFNGDNLGRITPLLSILIYMAIIYVYTHQKDYVSYIAKTE